MFHGKNSTVVNHAPVQIHPQEHPLPSTNWKVKSSSNIFIRKRQMVPKLKAYRARNPPAIKADKSTM